MIILLLLFLLLPQPAPCSVIHAPAGDLRIHIPARQTTGDIYATQPVSATDGVITNTVTLRAPFITAWPPRDVHLTSVSPYTVYVCRTGFAPHVFYLP